MIAWRGFCCLQEALPNPSISNVELVPQLQDWADEAGDAECCKLLSKKAVRDAFAARILQVRPAIWCIACVQGLSAVSQSGQSMCCSVHDLCVFCMATSAGVHGSVA
jgi:hypothetical protein